MAYIYKIINNINKKVYIGQTKRTIEIRWNQHLREYKYKDHVLYKAMRKYGIENFTIEVIENCPEEELNEKEEFYIKKYNSYINFEKSNGYNMTLGGQNIIETLKKPVYYINLNNFEIKYYNSISEAHRDTNISFSCIKNEIKKDNKSLKRDYIFMSKEKYEKIKDIKQYIYKKYNYIVQLSLDGSTVINIYRPSSKILADGSNLQTAIRCCKDNELKTYNGFQWCFYEDLKNRINKKRKVGGKRPHRKIVQLDIMENYINTFENAKVAGDINNIDSSCILKVCKNQRKSAGGYKWKYEEDYSNEQLSTN